MSAANPCNIFHNYFVSWKLTLMTRAVVKILQLSLSESIEWFSITVMTWKFITTIRRGSVKCEILEFVFFFIFLYEIRAEWRRRRICWREIYASCAKEQKKIGKKFHSFWFMTFFHFFSRCIITNFKLVSWKLLRRIWVLDWMVMKSFSDIKKLKNEEKLENKWMTGAQAMKLLF